MLQAEAYHSEEVGHTRGLSWSPAIFERSGDKVEDVMEKKLDAWIIGTYFVLDDFAIDPAIYKLVSESRTGLIYMQDMVLLERILTVMTVHR